jgi:type I restriction enzyme, S subunit
MEIMPGYKQTEVGVIPEDWEVLSTNTACLKIQDGTHFSPKPGGNDYFYITSKNIRFGYLDLSTASRIDETQHRAIYKRCDVTKGDLLLTKDGANTGNAALNTLDSEFSLLSSVAFLRFNAKKYNAAYFLQYILSSAGQRQIQEAMAGNAITRLTLEKINKLRFPLPPTKAEQEAIAEALGDADALIKSLEQLIAKKRQIKQGGMQELLTGKRRLLGFGNATTGYKQTEVGVIPEDWEVKSLHTIADKIMVGIASAATHAYRGKGVVMFRNQNIKPNRLDDSDVLYIAPEYEIAFKNKRLKENDLLTARTGYPGTTCVVPAQYEAAQSFTTLITRPNCFVVHPSYLCFYINSHQGQIYFDQNQIGGGQKNVNAGSLELLPVPLPPTKAEQEAIAAVLSDMDAEIATLETKLAKARKIKQGMMDNLLTGRIRLI